MQAGAYLDADSGPRALAVDLTTKIVAIVAVLLRFLARRIGRTSYWWDDWLILAAAILLTSSLYIEVTLKNLGLGRQLEYFLLEKPQSIPRYRKLNYADQLLYAPTVALVKASILCLYIRLFSVCRSVVVACYIQIGLVVVWALITQALFTFPCKPVQLAWMTFRKSDSCLQPQPVFIGTNVVNVIMDFAILITPLPSIWSLNLPTQKKITVTAILMLGACESAFSAARLAMVAPLTFVDPTTDDATALIWSSVENAVGVLCACIPLMSPLFPSDCFGHFVPRHSHNHNRHRVQEGVQNNFLQRPSDVQNDDPERAASVDFMAFKRMTEFTLTDESTESSSCHHRHDSWYHNRWSSETV